MVKLPSTDGAEGEGVENRTQLFHDMGAFIALWGKMELYVEIAICRLANLDQLHGSIILGPLQHKAKVQILYALLRLKGDKDTISKLKTAFSFARRNALIHSALAADGDFSRFAFFYRSLDAGYKVARHDYTADTFHNHVWRFRDLAREAAEALNIGDQTGRDEALMEYGKTAQFGGLGE